MNQAVGCRRALRYVGVFFASGALRVGTLGRALKGGEDARPLRSDSAMGSTRSIAIVIAVVLSACATEQRDPLTPRAPSLKEQSLSLKIGMNEQEVTKLLGAPSKAEVGQCGENTVRIR